jgi:hypothetical protein
MIADCLWGMGRPLPRGEHCYICWVRPSPHRPIQCSLWRSDTAAVHERHVFLNQDVGAAGETSICPSDTAAHPDETRVRWIAGRPKSDR